jgi:hypothetical protein
VTDIKNHLIVKSVAQSPSVVQTKYPYFYETHCYLALVQKYHVMSQLKPVHTLTSDFSNNKIIFMQDDDDGGSEHP